jgi:hypothetical protein
MCLNGDKSYAWTISAASCRDLAAIEQQVWETQLRGDVKQLRAEITVHQSCDEVAGTLFSHRPDQHYYAAVRNA